METYLNIQAIFEKLIFLKREYEQAKDFCNVALSVLNESEILSEIEQQQKIEILECLQEIETETQAEFRRLKQQLIDLQNSM